MIIFNIQSIISESENADNTIVKCKELRRPLIKAFFVYVALESTNVAIVAYTDRTIMNNIVTRVVSPLSFFISQVSFRLAGAV